MIHGTFYRNLFLIRLFLLFLQFYEIIHGNSLFSRELSNADSFHSHESSHGHLCKTFVKSWQVTDGVHDNIHIQLFRSHENHYSLELSLQDDRNQSIYDDVYRISQINPSTDFIESALKYGPDEIIVFIEGISNQAFIPMYLGGRLYRHRFLIPISKKYHLKILRLRTNYDALDESVPVYPGIKKQYLLNEWIYFNSTSNDVFCSGDHPSWFLKNEYSLVEDMQPIKYNDRNLSFEVYVTAGDHLQETFCPDDQNRYEFEHLNECRQSFYSLKDEEARSLLSKINIVTVGDSYMHRTGLQLLQFCDFPHPELFSGGKINFDNTGSPECKGFQFWEYQGTQRCEFDKLQKFFIDMESYPKENTFYIINCGHHPAAASHFTFSKYQEVLENTAKLIKSATSINQEHFFWMDSAPIPFRDTTACYKFEDWRTEHRLSLYNDVASTIMKKYGISTIKAFNIYLPFADGLVCDPDHYPPGVVRPVGEKILRYIQNIYK